MKSSIWGGYHKTKKTKPKGKKSPPTSLKASQQLDTSP